MKPCLNLAYLAAPLFLAGLLWWGGSQPFAVGLFPPPWDKLGHSVFFGVFSYLLWRGFGCRLKIVVFIVACVIGALDEWHQAFLPGRNADVFDWLVDMLASLVVLALADGRLAGAVIRFLPRKKEQ